MVVVDRPKIIQYDNETLKHVQNLELMIIKDFIKVCEKYDLEYFAAFGTAIGAVRHNGFIPWDDDVDIYMLRKDYEKFLEVMEYEMTDKYDILNSRNHKDFYRPFTKMSLKGTEFYADWVQESEFTLGINIDIFPLDNVPDSTVKLFVFMKYNGILHKFFEIFRAIYNKRYSTKNMERLGNVFTFLFRIFRIEYSKIINIHEKHSIKYDSENCKNLASLASYGEDGKIPKKWIYPAKKIKFDDIKLNVFNDYDSYLKMTYGDYMEFPPEDERINHYAGFIDFGKYQVKLFWTQQWLKLGLPMRTTYILLWGRNKELVDGINSDHINSFYYPNAVLNKKINGTSDLEDFGTCYILILVIPSSIIREMMEKIVKIIPADCQIKSSIKRIELSSYKTRSQIISENVGTEPYVLS